MSKHKQQTGSGAAVEGSGGAMAGTPAGPPPRMPRPLVIAFAVAAACGILMLAARPSLQRSSLTRAITDCDASVFKDDKSNRDDNGLDDAYGVVTFRRNNDEVKRLLSLCDSNPAMALSIFRSAMDGTSKSARLVALYSAFFLARRGSLEAADIDRVVKCLSLKGDEEDDVRKAAQRTLSDLTFIADSSAAAREKYERTPSDLPEAKKDAPAHRVATREAKRGDKTVLLVRWSNSDVARAWWSTEAKGGAWDAAQGCYVIP